MFQNSNAMEQICCYLCNSGPPKPILKRSGTITETMDGDDTRNTQRKTKENLFAVHKVSCQSGQSSAMINKTKNNHYP